MLVRYCAGKDIDDAEVAGNAWIDYAARLEELVAEL